VLYALGAPVSLALLLVSFLVAVTLHGWVQAVVARRTGDRRVVAEGRTSPDPRRHVDPFGAVAAGIAGIGWTRPVEPPDRRRRGAMAAVLLSGPAANVVVGLAALAAVPAVGGSATGVLGFVGPSRLLQSGVDVDIAVRALLLFGLANLMTGLLSLVPLPPLAGGRLLFGLAPRTPGWQKAEYHLGERNIGVAVLLALLLIPLGGPQALLPTLLDTVAGPLARLVAGG
jgi:Zn-dependent protease